MFLSPSARELLSGARNAKRNRGLTQPEAGRTGAMGRQPPVITSRRVYPASFPLSAPLADHIGIDDIDWHARRMGQIVTSCPASLPKHLRVRNVSK
jgi:hypothetical protein